MRTVRLIALASIAGLLSACGGGMTGTGTLPATDRQAASSVAAQQAPDQEYVIVAPFQARNAITGELDRILPPNGSIPQIGHGNPHNGGATGTSGSTNNLTYNGGAVQTSPHLYVVFWGSSWNTSGDPDHVHSLLTNFYGAISGSSWLKTVTQYYQTGPNYVGGNIAVSSWNDSSNPPKRPTQSQMAAEAAKAATSVFHDYSANASYVIAMPSGIKPSGFGSQYCAYHTTTSANGSRIAWTNLPYMPDAGGACGAYSVSAVTDGVTIVAGHEQAETETDPQPNTGWLDTSGQEIGDKCAWINLIDNSAAGGYATQPLWSNATSSCVQTYP